MCINTSRLQHYIRLASIVFVFTAVLNHSLSAQITTDRPDQTESSATVGKGNLQIETGLLIGYEAFLQGSLKQILYPTTLLRYGISDKIELRFVNQVESYRFLDLTIAGISDIEIGAKIELYTPTESKVQVAWLSHVVFPSGTQEISSDRHSFINKLLIAQDISETVAFGYNIGYTYSDGGSNGELNYSWSTAVAVNDKVGVYVEPYGAFVEFEEWILNFDAGFTYLFNPNLQFDFSFGVGVNQNMNYSSVGISWLLESNK